MNREQRERQCVCRLALLFGFGTKAPYPRTSYALSIGGWNRFCRYVKQLFRSISTDYRVSAIGAPDIIAEGGAVRSHLLQIILMPQSASFTI